MLWSAYYPSRTKALDGFFECIRIT